MEFSIQKVKRCGKSVLCPHRREAARVVFFTVFLPFLLLLLWGIFLYHSPRFFSVKQNRASRAGRVDKFNKKYGFNQESEKAA